MPGLALGLDHRAFISGGMGLSPNVQQFNAGGNAGLVVEGLVPNRPFDTFSIGTSFASYNSDYFLPGLATSSFAPGTEWVAEINYSININQSTRIMPNLQLVFNPGGDSSRSAVVVAGLQLWYFF
jgi:carbohydrate-selective porin OprB